MIKLNIGCGWRNFGSDWFHIDGGEYDHLHSKDIINLPFQNNSVDIVYASHVFEYFDRSEAKEILREWKRVLKKGGLLRLAVPDFQAMCRLYDGGAPLNNFLGPLFGKMSMGDNIIYHKTVYDYESLNTLLTESGFSDIKKWNWREVEHGKFDDHSQAYLPHMDKEAGTLMSLNVECNK
jgi:predicted SAM-dependent methyltransferase